MGFGGERRDTGWVTLASTLTGPWGIRYRVLNGQLTLIVDGGASIPDSSSATTISSSPLPEEYWPPTNARTGGYFGGFPGSVTVTPAGNVQAIQQTGATRASVAAVISYPVA